MEPTADIKPLQIHEHIEGQISQNFLLTDGTALSRHSHSIF